MRGKKQAHIIGSREHTQWPASSKSSVTPFMKQLDPGAITRVEYYG